MLRYISLVCLLISISFLAGCGETLHGVVKDTRRIGGGIKTIFVRE